MKRALVILTIFIGGNHEASNYLQELPYGGWVAPNIYFMGYANVSRSTVFGSEDFPAFLRAVIISWVITRFHLTTTGP